MASKLFPLRVFRSARTVTESRLMSFSDGGGEPSTQPFQPLRAAGRFLRGFFCTGPSSPMLCCRPRISSLSSSSSSSSSSSGVNGRLEDTADVRDDTDGPGVVGGDEGMGGGEKDADL